MERPRIAYAQRQTIEKMLKEKAKYADIADAIHVHLATIYRELQRCAGEYSADEAQKTVGGHRS